jgi:hypothetical protein
MKTVFVLAVMLSVLTVMGGCAIYERPLIPERIYTAPEIDAINAENECRRLARSLLQSARCGPNARR